MLTHALRLTLVIGLAAFWLHASAEPSHACSCIAMTPADAFDRADAVFAGVVSTVSVKGGLFGQSGLDPVNVEIQVSEVWKGPRQATITVETVRSGASCGVDFQAGREYLVYARNGETGLCGGTVEIQNAAANIAALGKGSHPTDDAGTPAGDPAPRGGVCGAPAHSGHSPLDITALGLLIGVAALGVRPKRRL